MTKGERSKRRLWILYGDQFTSSAQLIKPNHLVKEKEEHNLCIFGRQSVVIDLTNLRKYETT